MADDNTTQQPAVPTRPKSSFARLPLANMAKPTSKPIAKPATTNPSNASDASDVTKDAKKKDPLDVLEDILADAKKVAGDANQAKKDAEAEEQRKEAEMKAQMEQHAAQDAATLVIQQQELSQIAQTPEIQERIRQDQEKKQEEQAEKVAAQGYDIKQLGHTKL